MNLDHFKNYFMEMLDYDIGESVEYYCSKAIYYNNLEMLKYLRNQNPPFPWDENCFTIAVKNENLEMLVYLKTSNPPCPWDESACKEAIENGNLEILSWLRSFNPPCPWDEDCYTIALEQSNFEIMNWLSIQNPPCPTSEYLCNNIIEMCEDISDSRYAIYFEMLFHFSNIGLLKVNQIAYHQAIEKGNLSLLKWLYSINNNLGFDEECFNYASKQDSLEILQWLNEQTFNTNYFNGDICESFGNFNIL
jgi:hypothetical protein